MLAYSDEPILSLATKKDYIAVTCNVKSNWASGVLLDIKKKHPKDFKQFKNFCTSEQAQQYITLDMGYGFITDHKVICLINAWNSLKTKHTPDKILRRTQWALTSLCRLPKDSTIYTKKFTSLFYSFSTEEMEKLILEFSQIRPDIKWVVCVNEI